MIIIGIFLVVVFVVFFFMIQVLYVDVYKEYVKEFNCFYMDMSVLMECEEKSGLIDDIFFWI